LSFLIIGFPGCDLSMLESEELSSEVSMT